MQRALLHLGLLHQFDFASCAHPLAGGTLNHLWLRSTVTPISCYVAISSSCNAEVSLTGTERLSQTRSTIVPRNGCA